MTSFFRLLLPLFMLTLSACSPIYTTHYTLNPPIAREAQLCVGNCQLFNTTCVNNCRQFAAQCEFAQTNVFGRGTYDDFGRSSHRFYNSGLDGGISANCNSANCEENCSVTLRTCHTNCGGTITTRQVCTAFCDQPGAPPPPVPPAPGTVPVY